MPPSPGRLLEQLLLRHSNPDRQKPLYYPVPEPAPPAGTKSWMKQIAWKFLETSALNINRRHPRPRPSTLLPSQTPYRPFPWMPEESNKNPNSKD
ncbi:MAG UNVERIFIED_CONTAM: hypothetical protein LVR18_31185 [Planctomycetaceae bacterium]